MPAPTPLWLQPINVLPGPGQPPGLSEALIGSDGTLLALGPKAGTQAQGLGLRPSAAPDWWLAPTLVDPHSVLTQPLDDRAETLASLAAAAAAGGYGQVALLPWGSPPRDQPDRMQLAWAEPMQLHLWGSLSRGDADQELSAHREVLAAGAIGLAGTASLPPAALLHRSLQLGEVGPHPVLVAPRWPDLSGGGLVRHRVEALRAGWPIDPVESETLPLATLIGLQQSHPHRRLVAMAVSTREGVDSLASCPNRPMATVHWWHLVTDSGQLQPSANGWRLEPPLGGPDDRTALRKALADGVITAVAVHHQALDSEEQLLPIDQRRVGLAGHGVVLSLLWQALVVDQQWPVEQLWQALCWGPSTLLGLPPEQLLCGSRRWLLFDPAARWSWPADGVGSLAANQPVKPDQELQGRVRASGLLPHSHWRLEDGANG